MMTMFKSNAASAEFESMLMEKAIAALKYAKICARKAEKLGAVPVADKNCELSNVMGNVNHMGKYDGIASVYVAVFGFEKAVDFEADCEQKAQEGFERWVESHEEWQ